MDSSFLIIISIIIIIVNIIPTLVPGGGGGREHSREVWEEVCRRGFQTLTLHKNDSFLYPV